MCFHHFLFKEIVTFSNKFIVISFAFILAIVQSSPYSTNIKNSYNILGDIYKIRGDIITPVPQLHPTSSQYSQVVLTVGGNPNWSYISLTMSASSKTVIVMQTQYLLCGYLVSALDYSSFTFCHYFPFLIFHRHNRDVNLYPKLWICFLSYSFRRICIHDK